MTLAKSYHISSNRSRALNTSRASNTGQGSNIYILIESDRSALRSISVRHGTI